MFSLREINIKQYFKRAKVKKSLKEYEDEAADVFLQN